MASKNCSGKLKLRVVIHERRMGSAWRAFINVKYLSVKSVISLHDRVLVSVLMY